LGVVGDEALVGFLNSDEVVFEVAFVGRRVVFDHGQVGFVKIAAFYQFVHSGEGFAGFGKDDYPADRTVESMDDATKDITRLLVALFEEGFDFFYQRLVACFVGLYDLTGQLVESYQVVVLVYDLFSDSHIIND
jgi:hypothetical protein